MMAMLVGPREQSIACAEAARSTATLKTESREDAISLHVDEIKICFVKEDAEAKNEPHTEVANANGSQAQMRARLVQGAMWRSSHSFTRRVCEKCID